MTFSGIIVRARSELIGARIARLQKPKKNKQGEFYIIINSSQAYKASEVVWSDVGQDTCTVDYLCNSWQDSDFPINGL